MEARYLYNYAQSLELLDDDLMNNPQATLDGEFHAVSGRAETLQPDNDRYAMCTWSFLSYLFARTKPL